MLKKKKESLKKRINLWKEKKKERKEMAKFKMKNIYIYTYDM